MNTKQSEKTEARKELRKYLRKGTIVYTCLRSVSASGMSRTMDVYVIKKNQPLRLTWTVARALDYTYDRRKEAMRVSGCGMDMGFHVVHSLACALRLNTGPDSSVPGGLDHRWL